MNSPLAHKPIDQITEADLQALVENKVIERKTLEYKGALPGPKDADHKEFLSDVSSFANAVSGHLIFGIGQDKKSGAPVGPVGLSVANPDAEVQRLEQMILSGISPRIPNVDVRPIPVAAGIVIVIRIARSWFRTHRVTYKGHDKFYSRTSSGKYPMDVHEIRSAVLMSETAAERIREFRVDRTARIVAGDTPVPLEEGPKVVLHVVPVAGFEPGAGFDVTRLREHMGLLQPLTPGTTGNRYNLDGLLTWGKRPDAAAALTYLQVFRSGALESVDGFIMQMDPGVTIIPGVVIEKRILEGLRRYFDILRHLEVEAPVFVTLTLLGVEERTIVSTGGYKRWDTQPIDRDAVFIPEVLVENFDVKPDEVMKPAFDMMWNASGWAESPHYDDGNWKTE